MISTLELGAGPGTLGVPGSVATSPDTRRRILVIEPHADDAVLSVGGTMWLRRQQCAFVIATMATRSNHTRAWDGGGDFDVEKVSALRRRESQLAADLLGGEHLSVGMTDAPLRYRDCNWSPEFYRRHRMSIDVCTSRVADDAELRRWTEAVRQLLSEQRTDEVWFPLGARHTDHMLTADGCFAALGLHPELVRNRIVRLYQELPYSARYPRHTQEALATLRRCGAILEEEVVSVAKVLEEKHRLAAVYDSQDIDEMWGSVGCEPNELLWQLRELPRPLDGRGIVSQGIAAAAVGSAAVAWIARNRDTPRLRVLLTAPSGCWERDVRLLAAAFPRARFEIHVASAASAEVAESPAERGLVHTVSGGTLAWVIESLRLCFAPAVPTLFHAGEQREREARLLARLWLGSDTLVVTSMDQFASALRIAAGDG